jgi:hypothetical protein
MIFLLLDAARKAHEETNLSTKQKKRRKSRFVRCMFYKIGSMGFQGAWITFFINEAD